VPISTIRNTIKKYQETDFFADYSRRGRKHTVKTVQLRKKIQFSSN